MAYADYEKLEKMRLQLEEVQKDIEQVASLVLTTGYTEKDDLRIMDANEYKWLDVACNILRKYHRRKAK